MFCKVSSIVFLTLSFELAVVYGQNSREILSILTHGKGRTSPRNNTTPSVSSSNDIDVDGRYANRQSNGINYPENIIGPFQPSGSNTFGSNNNKYPENTGSAYGPNSLTTLTNGANNYPGSSSSSVNSRPENSLGYNGINYPSGNDNSYNPNGPSNSGEKGGKYFPSNGGNSNGQGQYFPGNNGGYDPTPQTGSAVAFSAIRANTYSNSGSSRQHMRFERTITDVGYGWNPTESYFECYYPGTYVFTWSIVSPSNEETRVSLYENGRETGHHVWGDRNGYQSASNTAVLNLRKGSRVELRLTEGRLYEPSTSSRGYNSFSGFKLN